ncbi:MAG: polysaccharide deacetylase family protein [Methanosarcinaceae archaeon]|nr:polysaccharide deacetylase family protein [Methanosarcinaceae archaeon]
MKVTRVCIRIDIDTVRDTEVLPAVLDILDTFGIAGTFFVTTGTDASFKNYRNYRNPLKLLRNRAIRQHGIRQMFRGLLSHRHVQTSGNVASVIERGHELGLHGYHHYNWMNTLPVQDRDVITAWISKGCDLFEEAYGFRPRSFASPGFATSTAFLEVLDGFGFEYSSDFRGKEAFYPVEGSRQFSTLQLPVAEESFGELVSQGMSEREIYERYRRGLDSAEDLFIFYMHPSFEPLINKHLLIMLLEYISSDSRFEIMTLSQLAKNIKRRDRAEDTAGI